jgi:hypothetical protein
MLNLFSRLILVISLSFIISVSSLAVEVVDTSQLTLIESTNYSLEHNGGGTDRRRGQRTDHYILTNMSDKAITGAITLEVIVTPSEVSQLANTDKINLDGHRVLIIPNQAIQPGESVHYTLIFANPGRQRFTYVQKLYGPANNKAPVITSVPVLQATENQLYYYDVNATDLDKDDSLNYTLLSFAQGMYIDSDTGLIQWLPNTTAIGSHNITVKVTDNKGLSTSQSFILQVLNVNYAPTANNINVVALEDNITEVVLKGEDLDSDTLNYTIVTPPKNGVLSGTGSTITYQPNANYNGADSFTYKVNDGELSSLVATVNIAISAVNDAPTAFAQQIALITNSQHSIVLTGNDIEGDLLSYQIQSQPNNGTLSGTAPHLVYQADASFIGTDSFTYRVNDGVIDSVTALVTITVNEVNVSPKISSQPHTTGIAAQLYQYDVQVIDPNNNDVLTYELNSSSAAITIDPVTGRILWVSPEVGDYNLTVKVTDARGLFDEQSYLLNIIEPLPPVTSKGKHFKLMFNINHLGASNLLLYISSDKNTSATVSIPGLNFTQDISIVANKVTTVDLTDKKAEINFQAEGIQSNAIFVDSQDDIVVYLMNKQLATTDATLVLPVKALEKEYIVTTYSAVLSNATRNPLFGIVATEDNTVIDITPYVSPSYQITLNIGETYQSRSLYDLSGTHIIADKKIAVFAGNACTEINGGACDHIIEQLPPIISWGAEYLTMPLATRKKGDAFRVYASKDNTYVQINGEYVAKLNRFEFHEQIIDTPSVIKTTFPTLVAQFSNGANYDYRERETDKAEADPFMLLVPPVDQYITQYVITTPAAGIENNYVNMLAPTASINQITIDQQAVDSTGWKAIGSSGYSGKSFDIGIGSHIIMSPQPIGLYVYGFDSYESYGYVGGMALSEILSIEQLTISASNPQAIVGEQVCITANLTDTDGTPIAQTQVIFKSTSTGDTRYYTDLSDLQGNAHYCYHNAEIALETIEASAQNKTVQTTVNWQAYSGADNLAPIISSLPNVVATFTQDYLYHVAAHDPNGDILTYELTLAPEGMVIEPNSGVISWLTPSYLQEISIEVKVSDTSGLSDTQQYRLLVRPPESNVPPIAPKFNHQKLSIDYQGANFKPTLYASDENVVGYLSWQPLSIPESSSLTVDSGGFNWTVDVSNPGKSIDSTPLCYSEGSSLETLNMTAQWNNSRRISQPVVGPLYDSNNNGVLDNNDRKAVIGIDQNGYIIVNDAITGQNIWVSRDGLGSNNTTGTLVNLDNDDTAEFVFLDKKSEKLIALNFDGTVRWTANENITQVTDRYVVNAVYPSDLDNDGQLELLIGPSVYSNKGDLLWHFPYVTNTSVGMSLAVDLNLDGKQEVFHHSQVRDHTGQLLWEVPGSFERVVNYSYFAKGNFDNDPEPEVVVSENSNKGNWLRLIDNDGSLIWEKETAFVGSIVLADMNNDNQLEIYSPANGALYNAVGELQWETNDKFAQRGATVADVNADGFLDILEYASRNTTRISVASATH